MKKLDQKLYGPFLVEKKVGTSGLAFRLALPKSWRVHPTFHVSLLELYREPGVSGREKLSQSQAIQLARQTQVEAQIGTSEDFEPVEIMDSAFKDGVIKYWVKWKDYPNKRDWTWEPYENVNTAPELLTEFHKGHPRKPKDSQWKNNEV